MKYPHPSVDLEGQLAAINNRIAKGKRRIEAGKSASGSESEEARVARLVLRKAEIEAFLNAKASLDQPEPEGIIAESTAEVS